MEDPFAPKQRSSPPPERWYELDAKTEISRVESSARTVESAETTTEISQVDAIVAFTESIKEWKLYAVYRRFGEGYDRKRNESAIKACIYHAEGCDKAAEFFNKLNPVSPHAIEYKEMAKTLRERSARYEKEDIFNLPQVSWRKINSRK